MNNKEAFSLYTEYIRDLPEKSQKSKKYDYVAKQFCNKFDLDEKNNDKFRRKFQRLIKANHIKPKI